MCLLTDEQDGEITVFWIPVVEFGMLNARFGRNGWSDIERDRREIDYSNGRLWISKPTKSRNRELNDDDDVRTFGLAKSRSVYRSFCFRGEQESDRMCQTCCLASAFPLHQEPFLSFPFDHLNKLTKREK